MKKISYIILLLFFAVALGSCSEEELIADEPIAGEVPDFSGIYSLNFMVTVDDMGSGTDTRGYSRNADPDRITRWENYINLERFRVLFFDKDDMFLFESKNRWVKQLDNVDHFSSWYVSIPLGPYGNDSYGQGEEYDWDGIRNYLTHSNFKIAILANRPAQLYYPGFTESELELPDGVFDNDGPYWGPGDVGKKSIFDLHHYQYDIIYADKGKFSEGAASSYYDFIMDDINSGRPKLGSAVQWVDFNTTNGENIGSTYARQNIMPSEANPIPMYGIQEFDPIPESLWKVGSAFDISNDPAEAYPNPEEGKYAHKSVALLRSCVRLDLKIPKSIKNGTKPKFLALFYSNIYSRTEPMDTWTPTDQIWKDHDGACEWQYILNYGPISWEKAGTTAYGTTKQTYQQRLSWFYGVWKEKGWQFATRENKKITPVAETATTPYPRIFNPCIQRNKAVWCLINADVSSYYNDNYYHYVVYTGERNINDPNTLPNMTKNPYIACFVISWDNSKYYAIPLMNYAQLNDTDFNSVWGPHSYNPYSTSGWPSAVETYMSTIITENTKTNWPYPLLRNHIYSFTLTNTKAGDDDLGGMMISSEVSRTPSIDFSREAARLPLPTATLLPAGVITVQ